jgi:syringomycin synthetase protein SyrE
VDGEPRLEVHEPFDVQVPVFDQRSNGVDESIDAAVSHLRSSARKPFDLRVLPLFRFELHELAEDDHLLGLVMHHIISDQWSFGVLASDLGEFYSAAAAGRDLLEAEREGPRPETYARWHRHRLTDDRLDHHLTYWRRQLHDLPAVDYPSDRPRPTTRTGRSGATVSTEMSESLLEGIRRLSASEQSSEFMSLFAAFAVVIHQATGADDIPIGVPIANRHHLDSESLVTSLVNTVVVRTDLSGEPSFADVVRRVRETALDAYAHQDMPFERLVLELAPKRETRRSPLFQYFFNVQNAPFALPALDGLRLEAVHVPSAGAQFDISVTVDVALTRTITVDYSCDLFDEATMCRLLESYIEVLDDAVGGRGSRIGSGEVVAGEPTVDTPFMRDAAGTGAGTSPFELPRPGTERQLAAIWEETLGISGLSRHDDFFDLGGYSLLAIRIFNEIEKATGRRPPLTALFEAPTIARLAAVLDSEGWLSPWTSLVRIRGDGTRAPVFYVAPFLISALSFHDLGRDIGADVPFYVLQPQGMDDDNPVHDRVEDMAAHYIRELKMVQPLGPYVIGGHCAGAWVAFEMVRQLEAAGEVVDRLVVVDVAPPGIAAPKLDLARYVRSRLLLYGRSGRLFHALRWSIGLQLERLRNLSIARDDVRRTRGVRRRHAEAHQRYRGGTVRADIALIRSEEWAGLADKDWHLDWALLTSGVTTTAVVEGTHAGLLTGASEGLLAIALREAIDAR